MYAYLILFTQKIMSQIQDLCSSVSLLPNTKWYVIKMKYFHTLYEM